MYGFFIGVALGITSVSSLFCFDASLLFRSLDVLAQRAASSQLTSFGVGVYRRIFRFFISSGTPIPLSLADLTNANEAKRLHRGVTLSASHMYSITCRYLRFCSKNHSAQTPDVFKCITMQGPQQESGPEGRGYSFVDVPHPMEGLEMDWRTDQTLRLIWSALPNRDPDRIDEEMGNVLLLLMESEVTRSLLDANVNVCATGSYRRSDQEGAGANWGILQGVVAGPQLDADAPPADALKAMVVRTVEDAARQHGITGLLVDAPSPEEQAFYRSVGYALAKKGHSAFYKYLPSIGGDS
jgi:hypothetical protein